MDKVSRHGGDRYMVSYLDAEVIWYQPFLMENGQASPTKRARSGGPSGDDASVPI
jgi:hypothetical protein